MVFFYIAFLLATEWNSNSTSTAEFLIFRRGFVPNHLKGKMNDIENDQASAPGEDAASSQAVEKFKKVALAEQKDVFSWRNVGLNVPVKGGRRTLLEDVSGWVRPGTLTALMGVSGAGKTTLLDTLAQRISVGVITGDMLVNGQPLETSFQRHTGYVQQQDLHLETATVREALRFSALLRQPKSVPVPEKYAFVEDVISMLNMEDFSEAIIGVPGEGMTLPLVYLTQANNFRTQRRATKVTYDRRRIGRQAYSASLPRRTDIWIGFSKLVLDRCPAEKARRQRAGCLVYYPPTFCHAIPTIRSTPLPSKGRQNGILRGHR
jgi:hypothetical protein